MRPRSIVFVALAITTLSLVISSCSAHESRGLPVYFAEMPAYCGDGSVYVLQVLQDGTMKLHSETVTEATLEARLKEVFSTRAERLLIIKADRQLPFQRVAEIIDKARLQADQIAMMTPSLEQELALRPFCCCLTIHRNRNSQRP